MNPPRSSSDIQVAIACRACNGNGGFGPRKTVSTRESGTTAFSPCTTCKGTGWELKYPQELTPGQTATLRSKLP